DPKQAPGAAFKASRDLDRHWRESHRLAQSVPSPAVYTPRLWRRYRELLLRFEHLVRADETAAAAKLGQSLDGLERDLDRDRSPLRDAQSWPNTLPLSAALGYADMTTWSDPLGKQFSDLWTVRKKAPEPEQA